MIASETDGLNWLQDWYASHCDGEREHQHGIKIATLDNPGWSLVIDLYETELETRPFAKVEHNLASASSWWACQVEQRKFVAHCGTRDLRAVIAIFRDWATEGVEHHG